MLREERELAVGSGQLADLGVLREERELAVVAMLPNLLSNRTLFLSLVTCGFILTLLPAIRALISLSLTLIRCTTLCLLITISPSLLILVLFKDASI